MRKMGLKILGWAIMFGTVYLLAFSMEAMFTQDSKQIIAAQAESIATLEQDVKLLRTEVARLKTERDEAVKNTTPVSRSSDSPRLSQAEMKALAATVYKETRGEPAEGKMLVAKVALNRLRWNPDKTLHQILHNRKNSFATGTVYEKADMEAVYAALADTQYDHLAGFHNPETSTAEDAKSRVILFRVGGHVFW